MDKKLLAMLVCPSCKGSLEYHKDEKELWCRADKLAYEIKDDIPVMLVEEARALTLQEIKA